MVIKWDSAGTLDSKIYECGWCKKEVTTVKGWCAQVPVALNRVDTRMLHIRICNCGMPTIFNEVKGDQIPGKLLGRRIEKLPSTVKELYQEIQQASSVNAYTLVILGCRKLLMHIAVKQGAPLGLKFVEYVNWFEESRHAPPKATKWIAKIKDMGNEANHEITLYDKEQAEEILKLCEMLLTFIYEYSDEEETTAA